MTRHPSPSRANAQEGPEIDAEPSAITTTLDRNAAKRDADRRAASARYDAILARGGTITPPAGPPNELTSDEVHEIGRQGVKDGHWPELGIGDDHARKIAVQNENAHAAAEEDARRLLRFADSHIGPALRANAEKQERDRAESSAKYDEILDRHGPRLRAAFQRDVAGAAPPTTTRPRERRPEGARSGSKRSGSSGSDDGPEPPDPPGVDGFALVGDCLAEALDDLVVRNARLVIESAARREQLAVANDLHAAAMSGEQLGPELIARMRAILGGPGTRSIALQPLNLAEFLAGDPPETFVRLERVAT